MRSPTFPIWDRALGGRLADILAGYRADGLSFEAIAWKLRSEHGVPVSTATVRRWCSAEQVA